MGQERPGYAKINDELLPQIKKQIRYTDLQPIEGVFFERVQDLYRMPRDEVRLYRPPDLYVEDITINQVGGGPLTEYKNATVDIKVWNLGDGIAEGPWSLVLRFDGSRVAEFTCSDLAGHTSITLTTPILSLPEYGTLYVDAYADCYYDVPEWMETNNDRFESFTLTADWYTLNLVDSSVRNAVRSAGSMAI